MKRLFNKLWVGYKRFCFRIFGNKVHSWIADPMFMFHYNYNRNLKETLNYSRGNLVDIGCGNLDYKAFFLPKVRRYVSIDNFIDRRIHLRGVDQGSPDIWADAYNLPFKDCSLDTVLSLQVLEHLREPGLAISEVSRVLKRGGAAIITTHGLFPIHGPPFDFYRYTEYGLEYLLHKNNLKIIRNMRNGSFWATMTVFLNQYIFYQFFEIRKSYAAKAIFGIAKIILTPLLLVIVSFVNLISFFMDKIHDDFTVTLNYTLVAEKI